MNILEKAVKMVGLHYDQSEEGKEQKLSVKSENTIKSDGSIKFIIEDAKPEV